MSGATWDRQWALFHRALELPEEQREAFLSAECGGDGALLNEVRSLLGAHHEPIPLLDAADQRQAERPPRPGDEVGAWRLVRELGRGGMGAVFLAERSDGEFEQPVAIKFVRSEWAQPDLVDRFRAERRILARLDHPNIARLIDGGVNDRGFPYFVMEYVDGQPLDRYLTAENPNLQARLRLFSGICSAVSAAHRNLVVHRDIKPANILVDAAGHPRLLDFGIARLLDAEGHADPETGILGRRLTPDYASPEQLRAGEITTASDIYSLGVLLYQMLAGERPYETQDSSLTELLETVCEVVPEAPGRVVAADRYSGAARIAGDLDQIVLKAMAKDPERRYPTADALARDIEAFEDGRPVSARADSRWYRMRRFVGRHRAGVAASVVALLAVIGFAIGMTVQSLRATQALAVAEEERQRAEAVSGFLTDLFRQADPAMARGEDLTVREVLEAGSDRLQGGLAEQPRLRGRLLATVGGVYARLGEHEQGRILLDEAIFLLAPLEPTPALIDAMTSRARVFHESGEYQQAREMLERALDLEGALLAPDAGGITDRRVMAVSQLAATMQALGEHDGAERMLREALAQVRGDTNPGAVSVLSLRIGTSLWLSGEYEAAEPYYRRALQANVDLYQENHPEIARAQHALAGLLHRVGKFDESERLYRDTLVQLRHLFGDNHIRVSETLGNFGAMMFDRGDLEAAESLLEEALAIKIDRLGGDSPELSMTLNNLALVHHQSGNLERADTLYRLALDINTEALGADHWRLTANLNNLGLLALDRDQPGESIHFFTRALRNHEAAFGADHPGNAYAMSNLGRAAIMEQRLDDAQGWLTRALAIRRAGLEAGHPSLAETLLWLGRLELARGRSAEARRYLDEALEIRRAHYGDGDWRTAEASGLAARAVLMQGADAEAGQRLQQAHATILRVKGEQDRRTLELGAMIRALGLNDEVADMDSTP